ncbi:hypothetical protein OC834_002707 [Tilletia horrida]|nr:hypothetical protein OC834_002707 [Tilletia horrida]
MSAHANAPSRRGSSTSQRSSSSKVGLAQTNNNSSHNHSNIASTSSAARGITGSNANAGAAGRARAAGGGGGGGKGAEALLSPQPGGARRSSSGATSVPMAPSASSSSASTTASGSTSSSAATLRQGDYRYSISPAPVRFPASSSSSRPASIVDVEGSVVSPALGSTSRSVIMGGGGGGGSRPGGHSLSAASAQGINPPVSMTGGGAFGGPSSLSSSSSSSLAASSRSAGAQQGYTSGSGNLSKTSSEISVRTAASAPPNAGGGSSSSASVAAFAPAPRPPTDRARPPNAASLAPPPSTASVPPSTERDGAQDGNENRERTRSGGLSALRAILGGGGASSSANASARQSMIGGSGTTTPRTRAETSTGIPTPSGSTSSRQHSRVSSPERRGSRSHGGELGDTENTSTPREAATTSAQARVRHHSAAGLATGSMPMSRPNSKVLTSFPFPHPTNPSSGLGASAAGLGLVLRSPRASPGSVAPPAAQGSPIPTLAPQRRDTAPSPGQIMQQRMWAETEAGNGLPAQAQGTSGGSIDHPRPVRRSFGALGLGLGFSFGSKSREQLVDAPGSAADADQSRSSQQSGAAAIAAKNRAAADMLPYTGPLTSSSTGNASEADLTSPDGTPVDHGAAHFGGSTSASHSATATATALAAAGSASHFARGLTTLARLPLIIFVPTLEVDWGSLPFGLGESRRRQVEDEANTREAEEILAAQVRLFEERGGFLKPDATPLGASGALGAGARAGAGGNMALGAGVGAGGGGHASGSGGSSRAGSVRGANYGAIVSAPPGAGPDLYAAAGAPNSRADEQDEQRPRSRSILGFLGLRRERDRKGKKADVVSSQTPLLSSSSSAANSAAALPVPPSSAGATHARPRVASVSSISSDPLDPYGYRSLAGPMLLPSHAEYVERRKEGQRRAARREARRRRVIRVLAVVGVLVLLWVVWVLLLRSGERLGWGGDESEGHAGFLVRRPFPVLYEADGRASGLWLGQQGGILRADRLAGVGSALTRPS